MPKLIMKSLIIFIISSQIVHAEDRYDQIRIWTDNTSQTVSELLPLGIDPEGMMVRQDTYIDVIVNQYEQELIVNQGLASEEIINDMSRYYASRLTQKTSRELGYGSMGGYLTFDEIVASMDALHEQFPTLVSAKDSIGSSIEGRAIWAFKISDNPDVDEAEPEVFYNSLIHAREPAAMMTVMHFAWQLAEQYNTDPLLTYLVNQREIWFVPVVNPDGYVYNEWTDPSGGGMHRKNRRPGCSSSTGIDLNRNWGFQWAYDDVGSSPDSCSNTYRGTAPFSEPETKAVSDFVLAHEFKTVFNYHSYGNLLIQPFGYDPTVPLPEPDGGFYQELGNDLVADNHYLFGTGDETVGYSVNGDAVDYMYGALGIINFTPEVGLGTEGGFWPPTEKIFELAEANMSMNTHLAGVAGCWIRLDKFKVLTEGYAETGDSLSCELVVRNKGLGNESGSVVLHLSSPDSSLLISEKSFDLSALPPQLGTDLGADGLRLVVNTDSGTKASLIISLDVSGQYMVADTFSWMVGKPDTLFADDMESGLLVLWDSNSWDVSNDAYAGSLAMTDSPDGKYPPMANNEVVFNRPIDVRGYSDIQLSYAAKWDIEFGWDFGQALVSTDNGNTWTALAGEFTAIGGGGQTVQPEGEPGYHGVSDWVHETISLNQYSGTSELLLGFKILSDNYVEGDGLFIDNLVVHGWGVGFHGGDITRDGTVNISDAVLLLEWIIQGETLEGELFELSDLDSNLTIDIQDLVMLIETVLAN